MKVYGKITTALAGAVIFFGMSMGSAIGAPVYNCKNATIQEMAIVPSDSATNSYMVFLTCEETGNSVRYYLSQANLGDSGWATLLTAVSLGKTVNAYLAPNRGWNSLATDLQMNP